MAVEIVPIGCLPLYKEENKAKNPAHKINYAGFLH